MTSIQGLREYKKYLIQQMKENKADKKYLNKQTREIDKQIKKLLHLIIQKKISLFLYTAGYITGTDRRNHRPKTILRMTVKESLFP